MRSIVAIVVVASGCFNPTYNNPTCGPAGECPNGLSCSAETCVRSSNDGGGGDDARTIDAFVTDAPVACTLWHPHFFSPCLIGSPNGPVSLTSGVYTYDTTLGTLVDASHVAVAHATFTVDQSGTPAWGMNVTDFVVASGVTLRVVGAKPLIIAAWGTIQIDGSIDASSPTPTGQTSAAGAGADPMLCGTSTGMEGTFSGNASGGGGGGGFGAPGGNGGASNGATGGAPGAPVTTPHIVRGGCAGGASGQQGIAFGGLGGGAIQLTAQMELTLTGTINAGGGGGQAGLPNFNVGGAGGGAGGFIGLEAATLALQSGSVAANGGGGASGGSVFPGPGFNGHDGALGTSPAIGGQPAIGCQHPGGDGGAAAGLQGRSAMAGVPASCTGGGGGGGTGFVLLFSNQVTSNVTIQSPVGLVNPF